MWWALLGIIGAFSEDTSSIEQSLVLRCADESAEDSASACFALTSHLARGEFGTGRHAEALDLARKRCRKGDTSQCQQAVLISRSHPSSYSAQVLVEACRAKVYSACEQMVTQQLAGGNTKGAAPFRAVLCRDLGGRYCEAEVLSEPPPPSLLPDHWRAQLDELELRFAMPAGFHPVQPDEHSRELPYSFAMRTNDDRIEVRYHVQDYESLFTEKARCDAIPGCLMASPDGLAESNFTADLYNISTGRSSESSVFPALGVRVEFNGTWGASVSFEPRESFAEGWSRGLLYTVQREGQGDFSAVILYRDPDDLARWFPVAFHALQYKQPAAL